MRICLKYYKLSHPAELKCLKQNTHKIEIITHTQLQKYALMHVQFTIFSTNNFRKHFPTFSHSNVNPNTNSNKIISYTSE